MSGPRARMAVENRVAAPRRTAAGVRSARSPRPRAPNRTSGARLTDLAARVAGLAALAVGLPTLSACAPTEATRASSWLELGEPELSARPGSGGPSLYASPDGEVLLTWLEPTGGGRHAVRLAARRDGRWTEPRTVHESERLFVNWADFPSAVRTGSGAIAVHWLEKVADGPYAYHVRLSTSDDGGQTWSEPVTAHRDDSATEHGFVSMVPWEDGVALVWLDGRAMAVTRPDARRPASSAHPREPAVSEPSGAASRRSESAESGPAGDMSLRFTILSIGGDLGPEARLDERTCECCQTSLARTEQGLIAAYRDRAPDEVRDISVVRWTRGAWSLPEPVAEEGWRIPGCPVNGPQLSAEGRNVVAAWFTGAGGEPRVRVAFSSDGGASFGEPVRVDEGTPVGRVDVELLPGGDAVVVWLEASGVAPRVLARRVGPNGRTGPPALVARSSGERASGFPRLARAGDELLFAWTDPAASGGVRVRAARLARE